jgi:hypothetical protein
MTKKALTEKRFNEIERNLPKPLLEYIEKNWDNAGALMKMVLLANVLLKLSLTLLTLKRDCSAYALVIHFMVTKSAWTFRFSGKKEVNNLCCPLTQITNSNTQGWS